jgi:predicted porin
MKRNLVIAAVATMATGAVMAQSSVTLYGRINETVERVKIGKEKVTELRDNQSFLGFKGTEDIGSGLKASFLLEAQFNPDDGRAGTSANQGGAFFGRESWVAIGSENLGRFRFGNMQFSSFYFATADAVGQHNGEAGTSADAFFLYVGNVKNTVAYITPAIYGTTVEVQYGLGEKAATDNTTKTAANTRSVAVVYDNGAFHAGGGYVKGPLTQFGRLFLGGPTNFNDVDGTNPLSSSETYGVRAMYEFTPTFNVAGYVNRDSLDDGSNKAKRTSFRISSKLSLGASDLHLDVGRANSFTGASKTGAEQYTLAYNYNLSKRTKLYAYYTRVDNDNNIYYGPGFSSSNQSAGIQPGDTFSSFAVGIRHLF